MIRPDIMVIPIIIFMIHIEVATSSRMTCTLTVTDTITGLDTTGVVGIMSVLKIVNMGSAADVASIEKAPFPGVRETANS